MGFKKKKSKCYIILSEIITIVCKNIAKTGFVRFFNIALSTLSFLHFIFHFSVALC